MTQQKDFPSMDNKDFLIELNVWIEVTGESIITSFLALDLVNHTHRQDRTRKAWELTLFTGGCTA